MAMSFSLQMGGDINTSFSNDQPTELITFCRGFKKNYGFCINTKQDDNSNVFFAKSKFTPEPSKTLPSLEP